MQAVVLTAGAGNRIRPLSTGVPKPMLPVGTRPIAEHTAAAAAAAGAEELLFVVDEESDAIRDHFGRTYRGVPVDYVTQHEPRGTADAVRAASDRIDGRFAVFNGDVVYDAPSVEQLFQADAAVGTFRTTEPSQYGILALRDGRVTDVVEKPSDPPSDLANAGAYVLPEAALDSLDVPESERGEYELTDVLVGVAERTDVTPVEFERSIDVGRPWELLEANEQCLADLEPAVEGTVDPGATLRGPVRVEAGATVEPGVVLEGPVLVREGATIGPGAYVRGTTLIGPDVHVGHGVEIKNSVVMAGSSVGHLSYVGDSVVGRDVNFGAGTNVANLRHDEECVRVTVSGERQSTGRRKFGVVVGHEAKTAINTSLNAGVSLSRSATTKPGEVVTRDR